MGERIRAERLGQKENYSYWLLVIGLNGMNSIYFIKWFLGKSAGNIEPQKERRTHHETKDDYLAAFS